MRFCLRTTPSTLNEFEPELDSGWVATGCERQVEDVPDEMPPSEAVCGGCGLPILYEPPEE